ncbi:MAG: NAD(P)/FAD-dependent oxidoreductase [Bacteroidales bacterium]|nr:NAD(P)/FAD-dependent oxidoreductase [Bacteroidales bacterium]
MYKRIALTLSPEEAADENVVRQNLAKQAEVSVSEISSFRLQRRSIDARHKSVSVSLTYDVYAGEEPKKTELTLPGYKQVSSARQVVVVGAGPGGLFAALRLIELGFRPVVLERGKDVSARKLDLALLNRNERLDPESNYAFGEGGAGTFSDGKLFTRSTKRGDVRKILEVFHFHGAQEDILIDAHPHIGTDKLPQVIKAMRETIVQYGGEVRFQSKVTEILTNGKKATGVRLADGQTVDGIAVILATGHSARDVYEMLDRQGIALQQKTWAMGVRVEHPQELIDEIQYHSPDGRGQYLPPATYSLVTQVQGRGVYSFCMCPGGFIVPAMTAEGEMVVNGMSPSHRGSPFANSGIVVEVRPEDIGEFANDGVLGGIKYQRELERLAFINGGRGFIAPAQGLADFVSGRLSFDLPDCSYIPGIVSSPMHFWLPDNIGNRLREGFKDFDRQAHGFLTNEALVVGVESRTSSPVRICRDETTLVSPSLDGLYPCGEGAGYAGGIVSSAIDGELCAERIADAYNDK